MARRPTDVPTVLSEETARVADDLVTRVTAHIKSKSAQAQAEKLYITLGVLADLLEARSRKEPTEDERAAQEIDNILLRMDHGIVREQEAMDALLSRLRTTLDPQPSEWHFPMSVSVVACPQDRGSIRASNQGPQFT